MGFGSAFKSAWNKASETVKQKVAEVSAGAKQVGVAALEKTQETAQKVKERTQAVAQFISGQAAKAADTAKQAIKKAQTTAKTQIVQAVEKAKGAAELAKQNAIKALTNAKQKVNKTKAAVKQKATLTAKKVRNTFNKIKKHFSDANQLKKPILNCPYGRFLYTNVEDGSKDGKLKLEGEAALYKIKKESPNASTEATVIYGKAGFDGARVGAEVAALKIGGTVQTGDDPLNPTDRVDTEIKLATAEAKGDFLVGYDTRRVGVALGGSIGASVASANVKSERNIPVPFTNWSISVRGSAGASKGAGVGAGGHGYWDKEEKRFHLGGFGGIKLLDIGLDISMGQKYTTRERKADW